MEDSLKGLLITATVILVFIMCILNFIVLFPQEQGITFSDAKGQHAYLIAINASDQEVQQQLNTVQNLTSNGFNAWDIEKGQMGSNSIVQGQKSVGVPVTQIFSSLIIIAGELFGSGANSPVLIVLGIFLIVAGTVVTYYIVAWVRTGK